MSGVRGDARKRQQESQPDREVPCVCGAQLVRPYPNDTEAHSTTECPEVGLTEAERLAGVIAGEVWRIHGPESTDEESAGQDGEDIARAILASDWLAEHDARIKADAIAALDTVQEQANAEAHTEQCENYNHDAGWRVYRCVCDPAPEVGLTEAEVSAVWSAALDWSSKGSNRYLDGAVADLLGRES